MIRVDALMTDMKANHELLGGCIMDYWWHIEFRGRGSPHLHKVIWVKNTPDFNTEEGIK